VKRAVADTLHTLFALAAGAALVTLVLGDIRVIAMAESHVSSWLIHVTGLADAHPVGTAVTYRLGSRWVGFAITGGCSVALLMIPPFVLAAILISMRRVGWIRGLTASLAATVLLAAVNQIRLYVIAGSAPASPPSASRWSPSCS
jgi:hypothetical protein